MDKNEVSDVINLSKIDISKIKCIEDIKKIKIKYFGRKGILNSIFKKIHNLSFEDKQLYGKEINEFKSNLLILLDNKEKIFSPENTKTLLDISLPGYEIKVGKKHLINKTLEDIEIFFSQLGFKLIDGFEIDTVYNNFELLNMPKSHPSRNEKETFYITKELLLRTHTSNMQIHIMQNFFPPFKILSCGKVYRRDSDISHTPMFHQVEGFFVDTGISLSHLKLLLTKFLNFYFEKNLKFRVRPSYFPFTEPSVEIDIECISCFGKHCPTCKYTGWIEVLGCGLIHPKVLYNCNIDHNKYSGFAFGLGVERITMIKHNIDDLRLYFDNNLEFLAQF